MPSRRHRSPWASRVTLLACVVAAGLLAPLWLDPVTLGELRGQTAPPLETAEPSPEDPAGGPRRTPAAPREPAREVAWDDFERRARDGFGNADEGGAYELVGGSAQTEVVGGSATVRLAADALGRGTLDAIGGQQLEAAVELSLDRPAREGEVTGALVLRAGQDVAYRPGVAFIRDTVGVVVDVVAGGVARRIAGPVEVPGVVIGTDTVMLRAEVSGSDPATINVSAWAASQQRPAEWMVSVVDWTGQLQQGGSAGLAWQRIGGEGRAPLVLTFDDLVISTRDAVAGQ